MFDLTFVIIMFAVMMILSVVLFFVSRLLFRIVTIATTILLIFMLVVGILVIQDAQRLNEQLARGPTAYMLYDEDSVLAGFIVYTLSEEATAFDAGIIEGIGENPLPLNATNTFSIDINAFENHTLKDNEKFPSYLDMNAAIRILRSDNPFEEYAQQAYENDPYYAGVESGYAKSMIMDELRTLYSDDPYLMKGDIYMMMLSRILSKDAEGPTFIFMEAKKGNVNLYPPRLTMRLIGIVPDRIIERTAEVA